MVDPYNGSRGLMYAWPSATSEEAPAQQPGVEVQATTDGFAAVMTAPDLAYAAAEVKRALSLVMDGVY